MIDKSSTAASGPRGDGGARRASPNFQVPTISGKIDGSAHRLRGPAGRALPVFNLTRQYPLPLSAHAELALA
ncbi:MAG: hypothetical protein ABIT83_06245 [Massilia sp.]